MSFSSLDAPPALQPPLPPEGQRWVYAGFWWRFLAHLIDMVLLGVVISFFTLGAVVVDGGVSAGLSGVVLSWLYFAGMESSEARASLGKLACGIKVVDYEGRRISFARATGRYFAHILSAFLLMLGYVMAAFTRRKQALHDKLAKTLVLRRKESEAPLSPPMKE